MFQFRSSMATAATTVGAAALALAGGGGAHGQDAVCTIATSSNAHYDPEGEALDDFGQSVARDGAFAVIGAPRKDTNFGQDTGAVFIWDGAALSLRVPSDAHLGDFFGYSCDISGTYAVAGAYLAAPPGAAYVLDGSANPAWDVVSKLTPSADSGVTQFGYSVAISGDVVVVGAPTFSPFGVGAAFVFVRPSTGWPATMTQNAKLMQSGGFIGDQFGNSVAIDGDVIVVGAPTVGLNDRGAAYVFVKPPGPWAGNLTPTATLQAFLAQNNDQFGTAVAISGSRIVVGALATHNDPNGGSGSAYVFEQPSGGWSVPVNPVNEVQQLFRCAQSAAVSFGISVAIDGDLIAVGSPDGGLPGGAAHWGIASVFRPCSGSHWELVEALTPAGGVAGASYEFGTSVGANGGSVIVGAPTFHPPGSPNVDGGFYEFADFDPTLRECPADVNGDGMVGIVDFLALLGSWPGPGTGDIDCDGAVNINDFLALLGAWGPCTAATGEPPKTVQECIDRYGLEDPLVLEHCICAVAPCTQGCPPSGCH